MTTNLSSTTITTSITNGYHPTSTKLIPDDNIKTVLLYAVPLTVTTVILLILIFVGIRQRHHVLDRWASLKRMRNTNPKFQSAVLRRDTECDSYNHAHVQTTKIGFENPLHNIKEYDLETIS